MIPQDQNGIHRGIHSSGKVQCVTCQYALVATKL